MTTRTGQTSVVLALVFLVVQTAAAERRTQRLSEVSDVAGSTVKCAAGAAGPETAADLASIEQRMQAAYEKISPAVVRITYGTHMIASGPCAAG